MNKKVVIGSILKPVNDARMYEKIATSVSRIEGTEIFLAGFKGKIPERSNIHFIPLFDFPRLSLARIFAPWKFYKSLLKVKPELVIITTHDLLIVTCMYKILFGAKIIYDIQENYYRNIAYTETYPPLFRNLLAAFVRTKEILSKPFISYYLLAERNYEKEFSFTKGKSIIIENKAKKPSLEPRILKPENEIKLLYSGTISKEYGIFEAINLIAGLHKINSKIILTIIGYSAHNETLIQLKEKLKEYPFIRLIGGEKLVPHEEILKEIQSHHFGLIAYRPNKSTINCIPTKLYEYLAYHLPVISRPNQIWEQIIQKYQAGIVVDFLRSDPKTVLEKMEQTTFFGTSIGEEIYWESEEQKLIGLVKSIL